MENNFFQSNGLTINDTFSMQGSLVSTIPPNSTSIYDSQNSSSLATKNFTNTLPNTNSSNQYPLQQNGSINISDSLVSLLSGIIIQSIHNGNPTLSDSSSNSSSSLKDNNTKLIAGSWKLDVNNGDITDFGANFEVISADGTETHWYEIHNFNTNEKIFFGNDNSIDLIGRLTFFEKNNRTNETTDALLAINNLQLIQLVFLDKDISNHFNNYPLYGTIDSINVKN
jgi:hypothetical protein